MMYRDRQVLITGGLGFIGSNLAIRLARLGARVVIVDSSVPGCGANPHNLRPVRDQVVVLPYAICEPSLFMDAIRASDVIFNLAGEISHIHSLNFPERDLQINAVAQMQFLDACRTAAPGVRIVYAGTRQVYGVPRYLPVDEEHPVRPVDFNGVHKAAAMSYHLLYSELGQIDAACLNLSNVYGPRMALNVPCQGFLSTFLRRLLNGESLEVFGDGGQLRDPVYVDDVVDAFLAAGAAPALPSRVYNVGGPEALDLFAIAEIASRAAGGVPVHKRPFPADRKAIDIGSYTSDCRRILAELGWQPRVRFAEGIRHTLDYYRAERGHYLGEGRPACRMPEHNGTRRRLMFTLV